MKPTMELKDLDKFLRKIDKKKTQVSKDAVKEIASATLAIESGAIQRSPVDTGNLKSSMAHRLDGMSGEIFNSANYAVHVEFGTRNMASQPFLFPSHEQQMPKFLSNMEKLMKEMP